MKKSRKYKIGWQKYEDYLEKQLSSPMLNIVSEIFKSQFTQENSGVVDDEDIYDVPEQENQSSSIIPISQKLMEDISMLSSYECWLGHTNFDITEETKDILDKVNGIEMLTICSRYRFFIGIGHMFDFSTVRKDIEDSILPK